MADFSHLPTRCRFIAFIPQWDFLDFLADHARHYPSFRLRMSSEVTDLIEEDGRVVGVRATTPDGTLEVRAGLTVGADGSHSTVRDRGGLEVEDLGAPIDVLWMRLTRLSSDPAQPIGRFDLGQVLALIYRGDYWQCACLIPKGGYDKIRRRGLEALRQEIAALVPFLRDWVGELGDWDDSKLLTVAVNRLRRWYHPGLLCIGDAVHAMSPIGGVGINLAIQDAVAAANLLTRPLREGRPEVGDLRKVERRRLLPTRVTQRLQVLVQDRILGRVLSRRKKLTLPWALKLLRRWHVLRRIPARLIGVGIRPSTSGRRTIEAAAEPGGCPTIELPDPGAVGLDLRSGLDGDRERDRPRTSAEDAVGWRRHSDASSSARRPSMRAGFQPTRRTFLLATAGLAATHPAFTADPAPASDPLAQWRAGAKVSPVSGADHHSIHTYYLTRPERPDGQSVLFYASIAADGHEGELRVRDRATGTERVIARGVATEDAHRAACQQWVSGGRRVAYHNVLKTDEWVVNVVDVASGDERTVARGRQLGFGQPSADVVPLYGPHWNPGTHRGLELLEVASGEVRATALTPEMIRRAYPEWVAETFGDRPISVFFPVLSPDLSRVFFKVATPAGGDFRSPRASYRAGLLCYDLRAEELLNLTTWWGHPAWHPNSRDILDVGGMVIDSGTGRARRLPGAWDFPGSHPSLSPDGTLFATDTRIDRGATGGPKGHWAVVVGDVRTGESVVVHRFDNSKGARSWRVSHPHPAFGPDGARVYFNVSDGEWTRLHVVEAVS